jgi:hypothetical protein
VLVLTEEEKRAIRKDFGDVANMPPGKLERLLASPESAAAGKRSRSADPRVGQRIVQLKRTKMDDLLESDYAHMQEVVSHLRKRIARTPGDAAKRAAWRAALMNWGHDPDA